MNIGKAIEEFNFFNEGDYITREMAEAKDIVLKELEKTKKQIPSMENGTYTGDYEGLLKIEQELIKRDRIIEEMVSFIEVYDLDDDIAKNYCGETGDKCRYPDEDGCSKCIIEYFTKKCEGK